MNAIILAAGLGMRLRPLTEDRPKCMVEVCGFPIIEHQIRFLLDAGIEDIILVGGYRIDSLSGLREKYGVKIVHNERFDSSNNIYSLYKVLDKFSDTYVIEGDVYMDQNVFIDAPIQSTYFAVSKKYENEWGLRCTYDDGRLLAVDIGAGDGPIMSGVSFWLKSDSEIIARRIRHLVDVETKTDLFWDNAVIDVLSYLRPIKVNIVDCLYEIDTVEDLHHLEYILKTQKHRKVR